MMGVRLRPTMAKADCSSSPYACAARETRHWVIMEDVRPKAMSEISPIMLMTISSSIMEKPGRRCFRGVLMATSKALSGPLYLLMSIIM